MYRQNIITLTNPNKHITAVTQLLLYPLTHKG